MYERGEPSGPMLNGTTYMVRPFMRAAEQLVELAPHLGGVLPVVGGTGVGLVRRADEGAVLHPGDVARVGVGPVRAGALGRVELGEGAGVDQLLAEERVLLVGPVEPVDVVRLAELDHLVDPREQSSVTGGGLHERHVAPPGEKWVPTTVSAPSGPSRNRVALRPGRWGGPCRSRSRVAPWWRDRRRRGRS